MSTINERLKLFLEKKQIKQSEFSKKINSTQQYVSALLNGSRGMGTNLINRILEQYPDLDKVWFLTGDGEMFLNSPKEARATTTQSDAQAITIPSEAWEVIKAQTESLKNKDEQIKELISLLKQQREDMKKTVALDEDNVTSAAIE